MKRTIGPAFIALALVVACGSPAAQPPAAVSVPPAAPSASATATASAPPTPPPNDLELAVGEAVLLEGSASGGASNDAIDLRSPAKNKLVVAARHEGEATILFNDASGAPSSRGFRVVSERCRDQPIHPAVVIGVNEHAEIPAPSERGLETVPRTAAVGVFTRDGATITITGEAAGRTTVMAAAADGSVQLWDVFVGGVCAAKHYASVAPAIPPGNLGPKGDGTCVRRAHGAPPTPAPCPDPKTLEALPKRAFSDLACAWAASCDRQGVEGCCVGCDNPFAMKLDRKCALKALRSKTCADAQKALDAAGCLK